MLAAFPFYNEAGYEHIDTDKSTYFCRLGVGVGKILLVPLILCLIAESAILIKRISAGKKASGRAFTGQTSARQKFVGQGFNRPKSPIRISPTDIFAMVYCASWGGWQDARLLAGNDAAVGRLSYTFSVQVFCSEWDKLYWEICGNIYQRPGFYCYDICVSSCAGFGVDRQKKGKIKGKIISHFGKDSGLGKSGSSFGDIAAGDGQYSIPGKFWVLV